MRRVLAGLGALAILGSGGCGTLFSPAAAVVDGNKITIDEVEKAFDQFSNSDQFAEVVAQGDPKTIQRQFEQLYLTRLVRRQVLTPRAADLGITVTEEEVDERIEEIKEQYPSEKEFQDALSGQGLNLEQLGNFVSDQILDRRLRGEVTAEASPTEEEIRAYYEAHLDSYEETRASHIVVAGESLAQRLAERLQASPARRPTRLFASLARRYSIDRQTKAEGGDLGYFTPGRYPAVFEDAVAELEPDEVSDPVQTELGYHVVYVTDRRTQPYEDVRDSIEEFIGNPAEDRAWTDWVIAAYEDADVKVNPRYGELDLETQQIVNASTDQVPGTRREEEPTPVAPLVSPEPSS